MEKNSSYKIIFAVLAFSILGHCGLTSTGPILLKENFGARSQGMGDAYVASGNDVFGMQYNPALLSYVPAKTLSALYMSGIVDNYYGYIGFANVSKFDPESGKSKGLVFGASISTLQGGNMTVYNVDGSETVVNSESDFLFAGTASFSLSKPLTVGVTAKYLMSNLAGAYSAGAFAADVGFIYDLNSMLPNLKLGASIQNIGTKIKYINAEEVLPMYIRGGLAQKYLLDEKNVITGAFEVNALSGEKLRYNIGAEYLYDNFLIVRMGYKINYDTEGMTFGLGVRYNAFQFDYGVGFASEFNGGYGKLSVSVDLDNLSSESNGYSGPKNTKTIKYAPKILK